MRFVHWSTDAPGARVVEYVRPSGIEDMARDLEAKGYHFFSYDAFGTLTMECTRLEGHAPAGEPLVSASGSRYAGIPGLEIDMLIMASYVRATWLEMRAPIVGA